MATDPLKPMTLEDLARMEADALKRREQSKLDRVEGDKKIVTAMPERFFALAKQMREGVRRFNTAAQIERPLSYNESAAVTTREPNLNADFWCEVKRPPNEMTIALRNMARAGKPDGYIIEGQGTLGLAPMNDRFQIRIDGLYRQGQMIYRATCDHKALDVDIEELGDRFVMVIVTAQLTRLWNVAPWLEAPKDNNLRR